MLNEIARIKYELCVRVHTVHILLHVLRRFLIYHNIILHYVITLGIRGIRGALPAAKHARASTKKQNQNNNKNNKLQKTKKKN